MKVALIICYKGHLFDGWQCNSNNQSIEGALKKALFALYGQKPFLDAASRTDKGVHALQQVVIFEPLDARIPVKKLPFALNSKLPDDIRVLSAIECDENFHPSLSCRGKTYSYKIFTRSIHCPFLENTHWHIHQDLDMEKLFEVKNLLLGKKDFSNFCTEQLMHLKDGLCDIFSIDIKKKNDEVEILISGDRFLYKMCRTIVGTLVDFSKGKLTIDDIKESFTEKSRAQLGITAPPFGLYLKNLYYPDFPKIQEWLESKN